MMVQSIKNITLRCISYFFIRFGSFLERQRFVIQIAIDASHWLTALYFSMVLRFDLSFTPNDWRPFTFKTTFIIGFCALLLYTCIGTLLGLYRGRFRYGSIDELSVVIFSAFLTGIGLLGINYLSEVKQHQLVPYSVCVISICLSLSLSCGTRWLWQLSIDSVNRQRHKTTPVLILGAGENGIQLVRTLLRTDNTPYSPIGFLDDDAKKKNLRVYGIRVLGTLSEIPQIAASTNTNLLILTIPEEQTDIHTFVYNQALTHHLDLAILPTFENFLQKTIHSHDIKKVGILDLLGRKEVSIDFEQISESMHNRKILVTGAGGSIGSELCQQLLTCKPKEIVLLDKDESSLLALTILLDAKNDSIPTPLVIGDIRDRKRIEEIFSRYKPEIVFHAAALKHVPILENCPEEAIKTNIVGTQNIIHASQTNGVQKFINISTDKAADPINVLGYTKRVAERITSDAGLSEKVNNNVYVSVRFGNVLASRGSVLETFEMQSKLKQPITVTDKHITRFFMTIKEAVQLVMQASLLGETGEVLVLDMGKPVRIYDVAKRYALRTNPPLPIHVQGLRPGEKLHETLFAKKESIIRISHPQITHVSVSPLSFSEVETVLLENDKNNHLRLPLLLQENRSHEDKNIVWKQKLEMLCSK